MSPGQPALATRLEGMRHGDVASILRLAERPDVLSFAGGLPAPESFLLEEIEALYADVLHKAGRTALGYGPTAGIASFRETLGAWMARHGRPTPPNEILVTTGGIAALDLIAKAFLNPGDAVVVGAPSYLAALHVFRSYEARLLSVAVDEGGMDPEALEETLRGAERPPKLIYLVPAFQNPSGVTLSETRRRRILELAQHYNVWVIEDGAYQDLRFEGGAPPLLAALDPARVLHINTLSKIMSPSARLGWIAAPAEPLELLLLCKQGQDQCSPTLGQLVAREFIARGLVDRQIAEASALYRARRDATLASLAAEMPRGAHWTHPEGGFYTWVTLPEAFDAAALLPRAVEQHQVAYVAGNAFYADRSRGRHQLRLAYSYLAEEAIGLGIARLGALFRDR
jgi:2-aminoadipate transaminase